MQAVAIDRFFDRHALVTLPTDRAWTWLTGAVTGWRAKLALWFRPPSWVPPEARRG